MAKLSKEEILAEMRNFYGTETWHKWSILFPRFLLTDGAKFVADQCGAYWLMDLIGSYQARFLKAGEYFQVWKLEIKGTKGTVTCEDGNGKKLARQSIAWTDFPLDEIKLYAVWDGEYLVILLPSEY